MVRQRFAARIEGLAGFREVPYPFRPGQAPAGFDLYPFSVIVTRTDATERYRSNDRTGILSRSQVSVVFFAAITPAEGEQDNLLDGVSDAAQSVIRRIMHRAGTTHHHHISIGWRDQVIDLGDDDGSFLQVTVRFEVEHPIDLLTDS